MKNIKIIIASLLVGSMALTSCDKYLTPENKSAGGQSASQYFEKNPDQLLVYAYTLLKPVVSDRSIDMFCEGTDLYTNSRSNAPSVFHNYTLMSETAMLENFYKDAYACINNANAAIHYANEAGRQDVIDEATFIRSYCYYLLTQQFGEVPFIRTYVNSAERNYPLTALKDIYAALIEDLTALTKSTNLAETSQKGHASLEAATALLVKVALAAGWDLNNQDMFALAASKAESIIAEHAPLMDFESFWLPGASNLEQIFAVQYHRAGYPGDAATGGHGLQNTFGHYYGDCTTTGEKYVNSTLAPNDKSMLMWEEGDLRFEATFMTTFYNYDGANWPGSGYYSFYTGMHSQIAFKYFPAYATETEVKAWAAEHQDQLVKGDDVNDVYVFIMSDPIIRWKANADGSLGAKESLPYMATVLNTGLNLTPCVRKWDDPESSQLGLSAGVRTNDYRPIVLLQLSDVYLDAAEAYLKLDKEGECLKKLNAIRERAGLAKLNSVSDYEPQYNVPAGFTFGAIDLLLDERARETYAQCRRWMDLRRTQQLVRYNENFNFYMAGKGSEVKTIRPIPQTEINSNTGIDKDVNAKRGY